ncbi:alkylation response protein AidB-like acyl-CoA dehydrogenase [Rhodoligotrophos appendicifer]|uniref:acyl-CoA dehydrogenase family protein n=1 Tax=Rhodoligotrophos appendicifer TaxID=987056 RepID=UPI00117C6B99|nr:acyl-CoA dehydrogenase family protein [Rhodoligotrophos appendicifer]
MSFALTESARAWAVRIRDFVDRDLIPWEVEAEMNEGKIPPDIARQHEEKAIGLGLSRMDVPKHQGGLASPILDQVAAVEQIGRVTNALGWCYGEGQQWMYEACNAEQVERYINPIWRGERHAAYAITEEGAGSNVDDIEATAKRSGNGYVLNGEKWHVTSGNKADFFIFQGKVVGGENDGGHALFFVEADLPGIELVRTPLYTHTYDHHHPIYRFEDVVVPADNLIGEEGDGMAFTHGWFRRERLMIAARCCGAAARLLEETTAFAQSRIIGGQPIAEFQLIQAMLADCLMELHAARLITYEAAEAHDRGEDVKSLHARCSLAKLYASEMAWKVADRAVQIFGGRGYMRENVAERFLRELRVDRIWEGTSEIQRLIIARSLLKRGVAGTIGG